jgi:hypothetical protein
MKRKMKRFSGEEGSQVFSEAQEKWLGGADRTDPYILARMRSAVPDEPKKAAPAPKSTAPSDNFYDTSSEKEIADASFKTPSTEKPKVAPPKRIVRQAAPVQKSVVKPEYTPSKRDFEYTNSGKIEPRSSEEDTLKADVLQRKSIEKPANSDKKILENKAKREREAIAGVDKNIKMPEPKSTGKKIREFFGYKEGGEVKRTSASKRGDGIATKGHTRGRYV